MSKYLSVIIGSLVALLGLILLLSWRYEFFFFLRGSMPVFLILGGVISFIAGLAELKDRKKVEEK